MFGLLDTSASALVAQRANMDTIAGNIANKHATRSESGGGGPYRRRVPLFAAGRMVDGEVRPGVHIEAIVEDPSPFHLKYAPEHPDAIRSGPKKGYVELPNVEYHTEMVNMMVALRAYEANVSVMEMTKSMVRTSLRLLA